MNLRPPTAERFFGKIAITSDATKGKPSAKVKLTGSAKKNKKPTPTPTPRHLDARSHRDGHGNYNRNCDWVSHCDANGNSHCDCYGD